MKVQWTDELILEMMSLFLNGSCIPELMIRYGWGRNKITSLLRLSLKDRYKEIAKSNSIKKMILAAKRVNTGRSFNQDDEWIEKRVSKIKGQKRTLEQRQRIAEASRNRPSRSKESCLKSAAKARETKIKNGSYQRHSELMAKMHASGEFYTSRSSKFGIKSEYESSKMGAIFHCDSNFERQRMIELDNDPTVVYWTKKHDIRIQYFIDDKQKLFVPDFLIITHNETIVEELKGRNYDTNENNQKWLALQHYCLGKRWIPKWTWQKKSEMCF